MLLLRKYNWYGGLCCWGDGAVEESNNAGEADNPVLVDTAWEGCVGMLD